ncbi:MAG: hypothetical protein IPL01_21150 [Acidobacteria bacterium]|nr:hypothetical protein [Acidobacteriota bacterium]
MEGASEVAGFPSPGHLKLGRVDLPYMTTIISQTDGSSSVAFTEDRAKRFKAYNWDVQQVDDGNDLESIERQSGRHRLTRGHRSAPCRMTVIGYGSPNRAVKHLKLTGAAQRCR